MSAVAEFDHYVQLASRVSGLPIAVTRAGAQGVADALTTAFDAVWPAQPAGAAIDWREERTRTGSAVWARRGAVFAVLQLAFYAWAAALILVGVRSVHGWSWGRSGAALAAAAALPAALTVLALTL